MLRGRQQGHQWSASNAMATPQTQQQPQPQIMQKRMMVRHRLIQQQMANRLGDQGQTTGITSAMYPQQSSTGQVSNIMPGQCKSIHDSL